VGRAARRCCRCSSRTRSAFRYGNYGYAAALGNVMVVIIVALLAVYLHRRLREAN
jgi:ABC-type sugar transport system permease subunit